jgi:hypothetical protein
VFGNRGFRRIVPRGLAKVFGVAAHGEFVYVMRLTGAGNLGLGINLVLEGENERERLLAISVAVVGLSALFAVAAGVSGSCRSRRPSF